MARLLDRRLRIAGASVVVGGVLLAMTACSSSGGPAGGSSSSSSPAAADTSASSSAVSSSSATTDWSTATSDGGNLQALVAAAKQEGQLNVITLPRDWANYGWLMDTFTKMYGIKITDAIPDGSSAQELQAITSLKGQTRAPDVVDVGMAFAYQGASQNLFAPYKVETWNDIPDGAKDPNGLWFNDYGGIMSIGCDAAKVKTCPTSYKQLDNPEYKGMVALNGDPTGANAAINAVAAVALANGGSLDNVQPGIDFFAKLNKAGIYKPVQPEASTVESGETPIIINWDYLNAANTSELKAKGHKWQVVIPSDSTPLAGYYAQAINATAPHPAAARLWEEFLYSVQGQNGFLAGGARPVEQQAMTTAGTINKADAAKLPTYSGTPALPNQAQNTNIAQTLVSKWPTEVGKFTG